MAHAGWFIDPSLRHEHRYWSGTAWTNQVADAGVASLEEPEGHWAPPPPGAASAHEAIDGAGVSDEFSFDIAISGKGDAVKRLRRIIVVGVLAIVAVGATVVGLNARHDAKRYTITGTFELTDSDATFDSFDCEGTGGYGDITSTTNVVVKDGSGKILANGELGIGNGESHTCSFAWTIPDIPKAAFYQVEISHRGGLNYSFADMNSSNWSVSTTLGS